MTEPLTAAARLLEWANGMHDGSGCVYCQFSEGHDSDCLVDAAIAEAAIEPPLEGYIDEFGDERQTMTPSEPQTATPTEVLRSFVAWASEWLDEKKRREAYRITPGDMPPASFAERPAELNGQLAALMEEGMSVLAIEREAQGIPLIDEELLARAMEAEWPGWLEEAPDSAEGRAEIREYAAGIADYMARLASESSIPAPHTFKPYSASSDWCVRCDKRHHDPIHDTSSETRRAGLPVEEGDTMTPKQGIPLIDVERLASALYKRDYPQATERYRDWFAATGDRQYADEAETIMGYLALPDMRPDWSTAWAAALCLEGDV